MLIKDYLDILNTSLSRGARSEIAFNCEVSTSLVYKVLTGNRENFDVIRATENFILANGLSYLSLHNFLNIGSLIYSQRGAEKPFSALIKEVILTDCVPAKFNFDNLSLN